MGAPAAAARPASPPLRSRLPVSRLAALIGGAASVGTAASLLDATLPVMPLLWGSLLLCVGLEVEGDVSSTRLSVAALGFCLLMPLSWLLPVLQEPLLTPPWPGEMATSAASAGVGALVLFANLALVAMLSVGAGLLGVSLTFLLGRVWPLVAWGVDRTFRIVVWLALAVAIAQAGVLVQRQLTRDSPARYLASLPVVARGAALNLPMAGLQPSRPEPQPQTSDDVLRVLDLKIARKLLQKDYLALNVDRGGHAFRYWPRNQPFTVRYDARSGLMFFDDGEGPRAIARGDEPLVAASYFDLRENVQPPWGWLTAALSSLAGATLLLVLRRRLVPRWSAPAWVAVLTASGLSGLTPLSW